VQLFAEFEAMASEAVDGLYGEVLRVEPRADGEYVVGGADETREPYERTGIIDFAPKVVRTRYAGRNDADMPEHMGEMVHVSFDETIIPYAPKQGDLIRAIGRPAPAPVFSVTTVEPDGLGRVVLRCKPTR
jgi:hypothetical protein